MFRDEKYLYLNPKGYGGEHTISIPRRKKKKELIKELNFKICSLKNQIQRLEAHLEKEDSDKYSQKLKEKQKELRKTIVKLNEIQSMKELSHKPLKVKTKRRSNDWIKTEVLKIIKEAISKNISFITKEDVAIRLQVKEYQVEQVFVQLNKEGILSQPKHKALHDSNRDPWGFDNMYGWAADIYYIKKESL